MAAIRAADGREGLAFVIDRTAEAPCFGVLFFAKFAAMVGHEDIRRFRRYRGTFRKMAGDLAGALQDLAWEKTHLPADDVEMPYIARDIEEVRWLMAS